MAKPKRYRAVFDGYLPDEDIRDSVFEKITEVAYPLVAVEFEAEDEYELATQVHDLENELQLLGWNVGIPRPREVKP